MNSEIKIHEWRFLSLIESEKLVPRILSAFLTHLVNQWKKVNAYNTPEERLLLLPYIENVFKEVGLSYDLSYCNTYYNMIHFTHDSKYHYIQVTEIHHNTGLSIDDKN